MTRGTELTGKRPSFIKNLLEVQDEAHYLGSTPELYRTRRRLGKATGAVSLGVNYCTLRPGQLSSRFHCHSREEEFFLILEGTCTLRFGTSTYQLGPMDGVSILPGGPAHQLVNHGESVCRYVVVGTRDAEDEITYLEV